MLKSMTGFGRAEAANEKRKITVEMKAVNHRYLDLNIRLPKKLSMFEAGIRNVLKQYVGRGKVDVFVTCEDYSQSQLCLKYNETIAKEYMEHFRHMSEAFDIVQDITVSKLASYPEVLVFEEQTVDEDELWDLVDKAILSAAQQFVVSREVEGEQLQKDILDKLDGMAMDLDVLEARGPELVEEYRQKIYDKVAEMLQDTTIDEAVLATEITIFADKICVDEEIVRLKSHMKTMKETIHSGDNVGRKLDFLAQEMNREANTILSKANDLMVSNRAIDLKTGIEKLREQIQNIE